MRPISHGFARPPINHRMNFPQHYYLLKRRSVCRREMFTTYGYLIQNVPIGKGMLSQQPRPKDMSTTRHRHDACVIRPERSLSVKQIQSGEYFSRPDVGKFEALMRKELMAAAKPAQAAADADGRIHAFARAEHIHADDAAIAIGEGAEYTARVRRGREHPRSIAPQYGRLSESRDLRVRGSLFFRVHKEMKVS